MIEVVDGQRQLKACKRIVVKSAHLYSQQMVRDWILMQFRIGLIRLLTCIKPDMKLYWCLPVLWRKGWCA